MASAILSSLLHPSEVLALVQYKLSPKVKHDYSSDKTKERLYYFLNMTSRSFAAVIQDLDEELKDAICIFYLVLRGLDTIEDDMTIDLDVKIPYLKTFDEIIYQKGWTFTKNGPNEKDRQLLVEFDTVIESFLQLKPAYQSIIADITKRMGNGMAHYATAGIHVETIADYDEYCHYVAGLVGLGLSEMFSACGFESPMVAKRKDLSNSMGLFLQKTNIIRDYLEDLHDNRRFWPKEIWGQYAGKLEDLVKPENKEEALKCLGHMITNAMGHIKDVLEYLSLIKNKSCFKFCAIPQVMAIATLNLLHTNYTVFTRENVKIRKGETVWLMKESNNIDTVAAIFRLYARQINNKSNPLDPHFVDIGIICGEIEQICVSNYPGSTAELRRIQAGVMAGTGGSVLTAAAVVAGAVVLKSTLA
ncbi:farnesyl-diphosphate farnesyltransferase [Gamsiella multidivaricata]|uniref:farnesyl-diphosphate farnesyltransferase n=1 Tax=Gamsiella multidivaricata TaxID=101098 RepID=UPI00221F3B69|nr:farnesyl-diphosphate farnesyltransferase [Gamsiella multidivaricata]KAI7831122.1 farnesyl-diphosphate farnesyltransferase [Gamsiella multidivaricata]